MKLSQIVDNAADTFLVPLKRAERAVPGILTSVGTLLADNDEADLMTYLQEILPPKIRVAYERFAPDLEAAVGKHVVIAGCDQTNVSDAVESVYLPIIEAAYCFGLAMGFAAGQAAGGDR